MNNNQADQLIETLRKVTFEELFALSRDDEYKNALDVAIGEGDQPWSASTLSYGCHMLQNLGPRALVGMFTLGVAIGMRAGQEANEIELQLRKMAEHQ